MGNKITSFIKNWLKPQQKLTSSNQNPSPQTLPDDVLSLILGKLDIISLCRCTAASKPEFSTILHHLRTLSTPLPPSFYLPERATLWYGKVILFLLQKSLFCLIKVTKYLPLPLFMYMVLSHLCAWYWLCTFFLYCWTYLPRISPSGRRFINKLKGLEFVELELPPPLSSSDYLTNPNLWFRWDSGLKAEGKSHFLFVIGDKHDENINNERLFCPKEEFLRKFGMAIRHTTYHLFTGILLQSNGLFEFVLSNLFKDKIKWFLKDKDDLEHYEKMHYVNKDAGKNGRMWGVPEGEDSTKNTNVVGMACYVPTTITVTNHSSMKNCNHDYSVDIKNVWLLFMAYDDGNGTTEELIKDCVSEFGKDVDDARKELGEAVMKILADDNRRNWDD